MRVELLQVRTSESNAIKCLYDAGLSARDIEWIFTSHYLPVEIEIDPWSSQNIERHFQIAKQVTMTREEPDSFDGTFERQVLTIEEKLGCRVPGTIITRVLPTIDLCTKEGVQYIPGDNSPIWCVGLGEFEQEKVYGYGETMSEALDNAKDKAESNRLIRLLNPNR